MFIKSIQQASSFLAHPVLFTRQLNSGSKIVQTRLGHKRFAFIYDDRSAREVLLKRNRIYPQNTKMFKRLIPITGANGLVQLNGEASKTGRKLSREMFSKERMEQYRQVIERNCDEVFNQLIPGQGFDPMALMTNLALRNAIAIFGGIESLDAAEALAEAFLELNKLCGQRMLAPMPVSLSVPLQKNQRIKKLSNEIKHILSASMNQKLIEKTALYQNSMPDHCMTMLFAGHETTASSLAFSLLLLAQNPDQQRQESLSVYKEALRLYPPAYMLVRECAEKDSLLGHNIKKGDQVVVSLFEIFRNPEIFKNPDVFDPKRFQNPSGQVKLAFFPFGLGPKSCIGEGLAYMEAKIVLEKFFQKFFLNERAEEIRFTPLVTLHPEAGQTLTPYLNGEKHAL